MATLPEAHGVPSALKDMPGWLLWRYESFPGEKKPRKIPYWASGVRRHGEQGSELDRARMVRFHEARAAAKDFSGIGFAPLAEFGLTFIDIDDCVGPNGELPEIVRHLASRTYTEYSPSGKGIRAIVRGDLGDHKSTSGPDGPYGVETFHNKGYVTITGNTLDVCQILGTDEAIAPVDDTIIALCQGRFGAAVRRELDPDDPFAGLEPRHGATVPEMRALLDKLDPDMGRDEWIRVGMALHHETEGDDTGFDLWNDWSHGGSKYVGEGDLRTQWDSFDRRKGSRRANVTLATVKKMAGATITALNDDVAAALAETPGVRTPVDFAGKYPVQPAGDMVRQKPLDWLIKGILPRADLCMIYGPPGSGKSFVALDMALAIARGVPWFGQRTTKGRVIVLAAEGGGGYGKRIKAYCDVHGIAPEDLDLGVITGHPNLMEPDEVRELARSIKATGDVALVVMDTLAQLTPGANENAGEDMGRALSHARVLRESTGATIAMVHHSGKDISKGSRGWSGILGALDSEMEVTRDERVRNIRVTKMKDAEDGQQLTFRLDTVVVGTDEDGDNITSCVVAEIEKPKPQIDSKIKRRGQWQRHVLEVVAMLDRSQTSIRLEALVEKCVENLPGLTEDDIPRMQSQMRRTIQAIGRETDGPLGLQGQLVFFYE